MKQIKLLKSKNLIAIILFVTSFSSSVQAQVIKAFAQRPAANTPTTLMYNIKGDYTMVGNTNLTLVSYGDFTNNSNNFMEYVDVDSDPNTWNSSSSTLEFSTENGAIPECSNILFAGLYWTGRSSNNSNSSPEEFDVTIGPDTKTFNKRKIQFKGPGQSSYTEFEANPGNIYYPDGAFGNMYSAFVEVTDYVDTLGVGEYFVADMALVEGNGGATGYYGGWGMIVVYENSKMNWRDVTIFDGHAYVQGNAVLNYELPVTGFNTAQAGPINMKLGLMAGEGDVGIPGDKFKVRNWQDDSWIALDHASNDTSNFFNGSVFTGGNPRNPSLQNNTGLDISMFDVPNPGNTVVTNSQTSTRFQYKSTQDTYIIFCIAMAVDAYIPDVESVVSTETINGVPVGGGALTVLPGEDIEYKVQIKNLGTEAVDSAVFVVPLPYTTSYVPLSITKQVNFAPLPLPNNAYFDPLMGPTGSVVWDFGTLPMPPVGFPDSVLAELTFHLEVTTDCYILTNPDCPPQVVLTGGNTTGVGAVSGSHFDLPFIQGYEDAGICLGEPINDPLIIDIDADQYIIDNCGSEPTTRDFLFCNYDNATIPFDSVAIDFPAGVSFYNENNVTPSAIEYDENNPFPATPGTNTYFAIPDGINFCYYTFTITVQSPIITFAVQTSEVTCLGGNDGAINLSILGGISPFTYEWTGPGVYTASTEDISSLYAGLYDVTIYDSLGCTSTASETITTIVDITDPIITCPSNNSITTDAGFCTYTHSGAAWDASATDECGLASITYSMAGATTGTGITSINGVVFEIGTTTITWTATDLLGNTDVCVATVIVTDEEDPTFTLCVGSTQTVNTQTGFCTYTVSGTAWDAVGDDNCTVSSELADLTGATIANNLTTLDGVTFNLGTTTVTWTVTDGSGNTEECIFDVVVEDIEDPTFTLCVGSTQTVNTQTGFCTYTVSGTAWDAVGDDNCTVSTVLADLTGATIANNLTTLDGVTFNYGTTTVTWTVTDESGNTEECIFDVVVEDIEDPTFTSCVGSTQTANTQTGFCTYTHIGTGWDAVGDDNCTVSSVLADLTGATIANNLNTLNGVTFNLGTTTVTWTVTDGSGNTEECIFDVLVEDIEDPTFTSCVGSTQTVNTQTGFCTYTVSGTAWDAVGDDNCTVSSVLADLTGATIANNLNTLNGVTFNLGTTTVTWTVTDNSGNTEECIFDVVVEDIELPTFTLCVGSTQTVNTQTGFCTHTVSGTAWDAVGDDNCTVSSVLADLTGATIANNLTTLNTVVFNPGTTTVTWTVTDGSGNIDVCIFDVVVEDNEDPVFTSCGVGGNQNVVTDFNTCAYVNTGIGWDAVGDDNCTVSSVLADLTGATIANNLNTLNGVTFNLGTTTVTWTVTDNSGNTEVCTYDVLVSDDQDPVMVSCGGVGIEYVNADPGSCEYINAGNGWDPIVTENCTLASLTFNLTGASIGTGITLDGFAFSLGTTTVMWTAVDNAGNSATCNFIVVVTDDQDPVISSCGGAGNENVLADAGECTYTHSGAGWDAAASDNCTVSSILANLTGATTANNLTTLNNVTFNLGTTDVVWTATDGSGNTSTCSFSVVVTDDQDPVISSCGASGTQNVISDVGDCYYTHIGNSWNAEATDNCTVSTILADLSGATIANNLTTLNNATFNLGTTTVTWTVTDGSGNTSICSFDVVVTDTELPVFSDCGPSGDQNVNAQIGTCTYTYSGSGWDASATDNCSVSSILAGLTGATTASNLSTLNGVSFNLGVTTVTWTVTDGSGNTNTCSFNVTVEDDQLPSILSCGAVGTQNVNTDLGVCTYTVSGTGWDATASDNCSVASILYVLTGATVGTGSSLDGVTFAQGTTTVTWTATDGSGNTADCSFDVVVTDIEVPVISGCVSNMNVSNDVDDCGAIVTWTPPTFTDNCGATMTSTHVSGDFFPIGTTTVTYTVTDGSGNVSTCIFDVQVNDTELPQMNCPANIESCDSLVTFVAPLANDNCGVVSVTQTAGLASGSYFPIGTTTVTYEALDVNGNAYSCSFDVIIHPTPILSSVSTDVTCNGVGDGSIDLTVTNGSVPYNFVWSNGASTEDVSGLQPGIYSVTVDDAFGCMATTSDTIVQPDQLILNKDVSNVNCYGGSDGAIDITISGGTLPYSFDWGGGITTEDLTGIPSGAYSVTVTDGNGCQVTNATNITQPDSISIQSVITNATCNAPNGAISVQVTGGVSPYDYMWSTGATTANLSNVGSGTYTLTVTDANNCIAILTDSVGTTSNLTGYVYSTDVLCNGGSTGTALAVIETGNAPFTYTWSTGDTTNLITDLPGGMYSVNIQDAFGCDVTFDFEVYEPDSLHVELYSPEPIPGYNISVYGGSGGSVQSEVTGGTEAYSYQWSTGSVSSSIFGLTAGSYSLIVTDANGCTASAVIRLVEPRELEMPEGLSPNGDGDNDYFVIKGIEAYPNNEIIIYNRWGNVVFQQSGYNNEWQGENTKGQPLPDGTYFVVFKPTTFEIVEPLTGYVDLRRGR